MNAGISAVTIVYYSNFEVEGVVSPHFWQTKLTNLLGPIPGPPHGPAEYTYFCVGVDMSLLL